MSIYVFEGTMPFGNGNVPSYELGIPCIEDRSLYKIVIPQHLSEKIGKRLLGLSTTISPSHDLQNVRGQPGEG